MKKTNITKTLKIGHVNVTAIGESRNGNAEPTVCLTTGQIFISQKDAADGCDVSQSDISDMCTHNVRKHKKPKGIGPEKLKFCALADIALHLDEIMSEYNRMYERCNAYDVEQKRLERTAKAKDNYAKACAQYNKARESVESARAELVALGVTEI